MTVLKRRSTEKLKKLNIKLQKQNKKNLLEDKKSLLTKAFHFLHISGFENQNESNKINYKR